MKILVAVLPMLFSIVATASNGVPFTKEAFDKLKQSEMPVVVGFHSPSCGSCKVQKPNLEAILQEPEFKNVAGLMAQFEDTADFRKTLATPVRGPSTIVIYRAGTEVGRILGLTDKNAIRTALKNALANN